MPYFYWNEKLKSDIEEIDEQHKYFISIVNTLYDSLMEGISNKAITEIVVGLMRYAIVHFSTEESYLIKYNYPKYEQHKAEHEAFLGKINDFKNQLISEEVIFSIEIMDFLFEWLDNHLLYNDMLYIPYLKEKMAGK